MPKFIAMNDESDAIKILLEQNNANVVVKVDGAAVVKFNANKMTCEVLTGAITAKGLTLKLTDPVADPVLPPAVPTPAPPTPTPTPGPPAG